MSIKVTLLDTPTLTTEPPVVSEPVVSEPVVSEPVVSEPVVSEAIPGTIVNLSSTPETMDGGGTDEMIDLSFDSGQSMDDFNFDPIIGGGEDDTKESNLYSDPNMTGGMEEFNFDSDTLIGGGGEDETMTGMEEYNFDFESGASISGGGGDEDVQDVIEQNGGEADRSEYNFFGGEDEPTTDDDLPDDTTLEGGTLFEDNSVYEQEPLSGGMDLSTFIPLKVDVDLVETTSDIYPDTPSTPLVITSGGGQTVPVESFETVESFDYLETESYIDYLETYSTLLKEKNQKGNLSKFSYEESDGKLIKLSLKTGKKTTITLPKYKRLDELLNYINRKINETIYLLKKKRDDIDGTNSDNFDELKKTYLNFIKYKKICVGFLMNRKKETIDNTIILKKKIEVKRKLFIITDKLKKLNSTTQNLEEREALIREYLEMNTILSLEKKIRENNNSNLFWNDPDNNSVQLKYEKILVQEPIIKREAEVSGTELKSFLKKVETVESEEEKTEVKPKRKLKLKVKYAPLANSNDASHGDENWDGPFNNSTLSSGKGKQQIKTAIKIKTVEEGKEECSKIDECKGVTEDSSKGKIKVTLRSSDSLKKSTDQKSWIKK